MWGYFYGFTFGCNCHLLPTTRLLNPGSIVLSRFMDKYYIHHITVVIHSVDPEVRMTIRCSVKS
jgi:hypothetical protein